MPGLWCAGASLRCDHEQIDWYIGAANKKPGGTSLAAVAGGIDLSRRDSTPGWSVNGLPALGWTRAFLARTPPNKGDPHLLPHGQPAGSSAFVGAQEDREHGALSRH